MSKKVVYLDDYEDSAEVEADAGTISFALEGVAYELDLSTKNVTKLRGQLAPWINKARRAGRQPTSTKAKAPKPGSNSEQLNAIRDWAGRNGYNVSPRGRIAGEIVAAFEAAQDVKEPQPRATPKEPAFSN